MAVPTSIEFFFDPACPWTWMTSRWLVDAAEQTGTHIQWRNLSLAVVNADREIPERYRAALAAALGAHRIIAALLADGRNDLVGDFYTEWGRRFHHDGVEPTARLGVGRGGRGRGGEVGGRGRRRVMGRGRRGVDARGAGTGRRLRRRFARARLRRAAARDLRSDRLAATQRRAMPWRCSSTSRRPPAWRTSTSSSEGAARVPSSGRGHDDGRDRVAARG